MKSSISLKQKLNASTVVLALLLCADFMLLLHFINANSAISGVAAVVIICVVMALCALSRIFETAMVRIISLLTK